MPADADTRADAVPGYRPAWLQRRRVLHRRHAAHAGPRGPSAGHTAVTGAPGLARLPQARHPALELIICLNPPRVRQMSPESACQSQAPTPAEPLPFVGVCCRADLRFTVKPQLSPVHRQPTADAVRPPVPRSALRRVRQVSGDRRLPAPDQLRVGAASEHPDRDCDRDPAGQRDAPGNEGQHRSRNQAPAMSRQLTATTMGTW